MELVKTTLRLRFASVWRPWLEIRGLVRILGDNPSAEIQGPPVVMDVPKKKRRVVLHLRALTLEQEDVSSVHESVVSALGLITTVKNESELAPFLGLQYDSIFIEPYTLPFHELVTLIKDRFLLAGPVVDSATDVGLMFDQHEGDLVKHTHVGPMEAQQLRTTYLTWPREGLPDQFAFVSVGCEQNKEAAFEIDYVREFLETSAKWQTDQAEAVLAYLRK